MVHSIMCVIQPGRQNLSSRGTHALCWLAPPISCVRAAMSKPTIIEKWIIPLYMSYPLGEEAEEDWHEAQKAKGKVLTPADIGPRTANKEGTDGQKPPPAKVG